MKKSFVKLVLFTLCAMCIFQNSAMAVRYLEVERIETVKFTDDFSNGTENWEVFLDSGKSWYKDDSSGVPSIRSTYDSTWLFGAIVPKTEEDFSNSIISVDILPKGTDVRSGFIFRAESEDTLYDIYYGIKTGSPYLDLRKRYRGTQWTTEYLASVIPPGGNSQKVNLKVEAVKNNIKVYVNNVLYIDYTDNDNPIMEGKVGLHHAYGDVYFSNFKAEKVFVEEEAKKEFEYKTYSYYDSDEIKDFSDSLYDVYGWDDHAKNLIYMENNEFVVNTDTENEDVVWHTATYLKKKFSDEEIRFSVNAGTLDKYFAISFRNPEKNTTTDAEGDGYLLKVTDDKISLEKHLNGVDTIIKDVENKIVKPGEYHDYCISQKAEGDMLEIMVSVDGNVILECKDTNKPILANGYISIVSYEKNLVLNGGNDKKKSLKQSLGLASAMVVDSPVVYNAGRKGKINSSDDRIAPKIIDGVLFVPLRFFAETNGASVFWEEKTKTVNVQTDSNLYLFTAGYNSYFVNGEQKLIIGKVINSEGTMYIPFELAKEMFKLNAYELSDGLIIYAGMSEDVSGLIENDEIIKSVYSDLVK